jgi:hypothetical protein
LTVLAPQNFWPELAGWVANLDDVFPGKQIKPYFAQWEVGHLLSLAALGGASILLNLRLIGFGLTDDSPSEVRRNVAPWLHLGVAGIIVTGILIGASNAERLYTSEAFTAKMIGLLAALVLTYGVTLPAAKADGHAGPGVRVAGVIGLLIFLGALGVFLQAKLANPGLWHVITAAALIVLYVTRWLTRIVYLGGLLALIAVHQVTTHFIIKPDDFERLDPANKAFAWIFVAWVTGAALVQAVASGRGHESGPFTKALAYAGILVWVMTAAAGRWLAFA